MNKGLTIIELIVVIAIIGVVGVSVSPFVTSFLGSTNIETTSDNLVSAIGKAQSYAMDQKYGEIWGVCISGGKIVVYSGSCAAPITFDDFSIPGSVVVTGITDVGFNIRGEPSAPLSVSLVSPTRSTQIDLTAAGAININ